MLNFAIIVTLFVSVLLVIVVLAQNSKGGGLTTNMGGATQIMGARRTTDWIERATWILAGTLFFLCLLMNVFIDRNQAGFVSPNVEKAKASAPANIPSETQQPAQQEGGAATENK